MTGASCRREVKEEMLNPRIVCVIRRWRKLLAENAPADIIPEKIPGPVAVIKRRVGDNIIGLQVFVHIVQKRAFVVPFDIARIDMADCKVHLRQSPGGLVALLPVNRDSVRRVQG